jgi:hypothetical protein
MPGQRVTLPDLSQSAQVTFDAASFGAFQVVVDQPVPMATAFATAWERDTRPGCPPYANRTNTGTTQISELVGSITMPGLVDQATGAALTVDDNGQTVDTSAMVLRSRGRLELDVLISPGPLTEGFVLGFARAAESKLKGSLGPSSSAHTISSTNARWKNSQVLHNGAVRYMTTWLWGGTRRMAG